MNYDDCSKYLSSVFLTKDLEICIPKMIQSGNLVTQKDFKVTTIWCLENNFRREAGLTKFAYMKYRFYDAQLSLMLVITTPTHSAWSVYK